LHGLVQEVEVAIADRYVTLRIGDWVKLPRVGSGQVLDRQGLSVRFLVPSIALTVPDEPIKGYHFGYLHLEPVALGADRPVGPPGYYWLLAANRRWRVVERIAEGDWGRIPDFSVAWAPCWTPLPRPG